jgi:hypothetical protein
MCSLGYCHAFLLSTAGVDGLELFTVAFRWLHKNTLLEMHGSMNVKTISSPYTECVFVALVIQHAKCMRHITLSSVAFRLYSIFPHYLLTA